MTIKKTIKIFTVFLMVLCMALFGFMSYGARMIPDSVASVCGLSVNAPLFSADSQTAGQAAYEIRFLQVFPVKTVSVAAKERRYVTVGGELVGIRLRTEGVAVVGTEPFESENGPADPAKDAGIRAGDILLRLNGTPVTSNKTLTALIEAGGGAPMTAELDRDGERLTCTLIPQKTAATGMYKCGLWVRDSTAGIGTLTFSDVETGRIATLGHAICDVDTGQILRVMNGGVYTASVVAVTKGTRGKAGEIEGRIGTEQLGTVDKNCDGGVYGSLSLVENAEAVFPVATASEVHKGPAQVLCTVSVAGKRTYDIEIERVSLNGDGERDMTVKVTDSALLAETGGIVQGMSGSPILQDGRLVGAVTHVFVNDPHSGYAIFAERMLEEAVVPTG